MYSCVSLSAVECWSVLLGVTNLEDVVGVFVGVFVAERVHAAFVVVFV